MSGHIYIWIEQVRNLFISNSLYLFQADFSKEKWNISMNLNWHHLLFIIIHSFQSWRSNFSTMEANIWESFNDTVITVLYIYWICTYLYRWYEATKEHRTIEMATHMHKETEREKRISPRDQKREEMGNEQNRFKSQTQKVPNKEQTKCKIWLLDSFARKAY